MLERGYFLSSFWKWVLVMMSMRFLPKAMAIAFLSLGSTTQAMEIPSVFQNIVPDGDTLAVESKDGSLLRLDNDRPIATIDMVRGSPRGSDDGFIFTFQDTQHDLVLSGGRVVYALIDMKGHKFPTPKYKYDTKIDDQGYAYAVMNGRLNQNADFTHWRARGKGHLYYRVESASGEIS
jgi:hypothetical protein